VKIDRPESGRGRSSGAASGAQRRVNQVRSAFVDALADASRARPAGPSDADLEQVDRCAERLRQSPTMEHLLAYRAAIKSFLSQLLAAYRVEEIRGFNRFGRRSIAVLVRTIDARLEALAHSVLYKSQDTLALAAKLDDIRGLLIDHLR